MIPLRESWWRQRIKIELKRWGAKDMKDIEDVLTSIPLDVTFDITKEEAQRLADLVIEEIESQPFAWPPLNPEYKKSKKRAGLNEEMLKATEEYIENIGIVESEKGEKSFRIRVGVPNRVHENSNIKLDDLARIHELGTSKIPARPHWFPVYKRWKHSVPFLIQRIQRKVSGDVEKKIRKVIFPQSDAWKVKPK